MSGISWLWQFIGSNRVRVLSLPECQAQYTVMTCVSVLVHMEQQSLEGIRHRFFIHLFFSSQSRMWKGQN